MNWLWMIPLFPIGVIGIYIIAVAWFELIFWLEDFRRQWRLRKIFEQNQRRSELE